MNEKEIYVMIEHLHGQVTDISYIMLANARPVAASLGGNVVAVLLGYQAQELAKNLAADRVLYYESPDLADYNPNLYRKVMADLIQDKQPRLVLFGDTTIGVEIAGPLSVSLKLPLVSYCRQIALAGENLKYTSQICGGRIMVEGSLPTPTAIVTMVPGAFKAEQGRSSQAPVVVWADVPSLKAKAIHFKQLLEPETGDVDITKETVLVSVGRGIQNQDNLEMVTELAQALGGTVCASRPVIDQGWLPMTRLVGKSGKRVKPKIYLALGISGAPEHAEAITDSEMIIAVNTDPQAPIFNLAKYGTTVDLFDLVPALTDAVNAFRKVHA